MEVNTPTSVQPQIPPVSVPPPVVSPVTPAVPPAPVKKPSFLIPVAAVFLLLAIIIIFFIFGSGSLLGPPVSKKCDVSYDATNDKEYKFCFTMLADSSNTGRGAEDFITYASAKTINYGGAYYPNINIKRLNDMDTTKPLSINAETVRSEMATSFNAEATPAVKSKAGGLDVYVFEFLLDQGRFWQINAVLSYDGRIWVLYGGVPSANKFWYEKIFRNAISSFTFTN